MSRTLYEKLSEIISVKDFGAFGDSVTDDTSAIQNADANGYPLFPDGAFLVNNLTLTNPPILVGDVKFKPASGSSFVIKLSDNNSNYGNCVVGTRH